MGSFAPGSGSGSTILRLLRLLRVIKLAKTFPQLALLVNALINGLGSIGYVGLILLLTFYVFSILGLILFQEADPWSFGSLHLTVFTLFRSATLDNWYETLMISIYGCDKALGIYQLFPELCQTPKTLPIFAVFYTLIFLVISSQVLLVLFIGVVSTSMDEARDDNEVKNIIYDELKEIAEERGLT